MITRVRVKNYRSLADVDVKLGRLTVLVGRNGAGKSSFVDALRFVRDALQINLEHAVNVRRGIGSLSRWTPEKQTEIEFALNFGFGFNSIDIWTEYSFALSCQSDGSYQVTHEKWSVNSSVVSDNDKDTFETRDGKWIKVPAYFSSDSLASIDRRALIIPQHIRWSGRMFSPISYFMSFYDVLPSALRPPQQLTINEQLTENGENLASVLSRLCQDEASKQKILTSLAQVVEDVIDIRVQSIGEYLVAELAHAIPATSAKQNGSVPWFPLSQESDGTLRLLALLVALSRDTKNGLLAFEEPEISLHPGALGVISDELREAAYRHQILITTQSPDLITRFNADELRIVERVNGATQIGPLDEIQRESINEELFSAGDLLRIEGLHREPVVLSRGRHA